MSDQLKTHYVLVMATAQGLSVSVCGIVVHNVDATQEMTEVTCGRCQKTVYYTVDVDIKAKYRDQLVEQATQVVAEQSIDSVESEYVDYPDLPDEFLDLGHGFADDQVPDLGTRHLPVEVVVHPFTLSLWFSTEKDNPRLGGGYSKFTFGDRENPKDLTSEEVEYVRAVFELFLKGARESKT